MKVLNNIFRVLTVVFGVAALALFVFVDFGEINNVIEGAVARTGAEFAFGTSFNGHEVGKSSDILLMMITTALTVVFGALSFKYKKTRWATCGFGAFTTVYMLVIALSSANKFLDTQGFAGFETVRYLNNAPLAISIAIGLCFVSSVAYLLVSDKIECAANGNATILKRFVKFLRDYKGEVKKIVWPNVRSVVKNTIIVLIMCGILTAIVCGFDFGLSALVNLILGK